MNWKTAMWLSIWTAMDDPTVRQKEHDRTVQTLKGLIKSDPAHADLYRGCLAKLETGYDL